MQTWFTHSAYSNLGGYRTLIRDLPAHLSILSAAARNVIGHYRAELIELPATRRHEVNSRWLETILGADQCRHPYSLLQPRPPAERVAGCCRDHSLFVVGALRERHIPACTRVGFASYLIAGHHIAHVIAESWTGTRWRRTDPEMLPGSVDFDPEDMPTGTDAPFQTAAEAWRAHRRGDVDARLYCIFPESELSGPNLLRTYVVFDVAHRFGDELLLWDRWGGNR